MTHSRMVEAVCSAVALMLLAGCSNVNRSMLFFTGTTVGLEISVEPQSTTPTKIVIGYKRGEGVLNPVYSEVTTTVTEGSKTTVTTTPSYRADAYSVLAKIAGEVGGGSETTVGAGLKGAQWFATGAAATYLSQQPGIASVLTNDPKVAAEAAKASQYGSRLEGAALAVAMADMSSVRTFLEKMKSTDPEAAKLLSELDGVATVVPNKYELDMYQFEWDVISPDTGTLKQDQNAKKAELVPGAGLEKALHYWSVLRQTVEALAAAKGFRDSAGKKLLFQLISDPAPRNPTGVELNAVDSMHANASKEFKGFDATIRVLPVLQAAAAYRNRKISGE